MKKIGDYTVYHEHISNIEGTSAKITFFFLKQEYKLVKFWIGASKMLSVASALNLNESGSVFLSWSSTFIAIFNVELNFVKAGHM